MIFRISMQNCGQDLSQLFTCIKCMILAMIPPLWVVLDQMHVYLDKVMSIIMDQRIVLFSIKVLVSSPSCCTQESVLLPAGNEWTQEQKSIGVWLARLRMYYYTNHVKYRYLGQKHFTEWYFSNKVLLPMETFRSRPMATLESTPI